MPVTWPVARSYNFANGSTADADQVDTEFDALVAAVNELRTLSNNSFNEVKNVAGTALDVFGITSGDVFTLGHASLAANLQGSSVKLNNVAISLAGAFTTAGAYGLTLTATALTNVTLPTTGTLATLAGSETLTNKTLTSPTINGGTHTAITSLGIRSTGSGAFDLTLANTENLTAGRTLTLTLNDAARTINLAGNLTLAGALATSGAYDLTLTLTAATSVTLPTTGTLATVAGTESLSNKTYSGTTLTLAQGTITDPATLISGTVTWNDAADTFTALKLNITDTASAAASLLMDLQVASASKFSVTKAGAGTFAGNLTVAGSTGASITALRAAFVAGSGTPKARFMQAEANNRFDLFANASYDGANYNRDDTAKSAVFLTANNANPLALYYAAAGANPIAWTELFTVATNGNVTFADTITVKQLKVSKPGDNAYVIIRDGMAAFLDMQDAGAAANAKWFRWLNNDGALYLRSLNDDLTTRNNVLQVTAATGDVSFDSGTLFVDAANNGIVVNGTSLTAGYVAQINGAIYLTSTSLAPLIEATNNGTNSEWRFKGKTAAAAAQQWDHGMNISLTSADYEIYDGTASRLVFKILRSTSYAYGWNGSALADVHVGASTKTTAAAPYANDGYITVYIGGTAVKLMTTA